MGTIEWLLLHAGEYTQLITFLGVIGGIATWVARVLIQSKKNVDALVASIADIKSQLQPNGGTSLFDIVKKSVKTSEETASKMATVIEAVDKVRAYQWQFAEALAVHPIWETDEHGNCTRVNMAYAKLAGRFPTELIGSGWENFISPADRARVFAEWTNAVDKRRSFESDFTVQSKDGKRYMVKAIATPVTTPDGKVVSYLGRYEQVTLI